tara:strand:+ start:9698 stop:10798 length:1101 start_codon:yes stop_codon:yes gene_type:complete
MSSQIHFPYMTWAQTQSMRSAYPLSQSGMPPPDPGWLGPLDPVDVLTWPNIEALPSLEARLAELFRVDPARVLVAPGASGAMHLVARRWFGTGAVVAHETPSYEPLHALPTVHGARAVAVPRAMERGWAWNPDHVDAALKGAKPGHAILSNPNNPTGAVMGKRPLRALADICADHGGVLVSCEAYMEAAPTGQREHAAVLAPNAISIGTFTKAYGLGPIRVGWIVLGEGLVDERERLKDNAFLTWVDPPTASLIAAHRALDHLPQLLQPVRRVEAECKPLLDRWLRETPGVEAIVPPYGIFAFPRIVGVDDTKALGDYLATHHDVDVVPGEYFGAPGHIRVGCGVPQATLEVGLQKLTAGLAAYRG